MKEVYSAFLNLALSTSAPMNRGTSARRLCRNRKETVNIVMPVKTGIQNMLIILDSPVSSTGRAQSRASLARNDKKVITTQSPAEDTKVALRA
ncbi:MAG TPA: hypothetical protein PLX58_05595 [Smithellaceae bacterium]|nr:hypothetical protein [Smithellaceae bacterium]HQF84428.1 hypothetical protein [Smithellaceae bacterium]HQG80269.1 hypothetical protein [Smithellaceae bacterium]